MTRYYFDVGEFVLARDTEGVECANDAAAMRHAYALIARCRTETPAIGSTDPWKGWVVIIRENGRRVAEISFGNDPL